MADTTPPTLPGKQEFPAAPAKSRIAPRILVGCAIGVVLVLLLIAGISVLFYTTARKGHDRTMAEYVSYFEAHQDCFRRLAEMEDAGEDPAAAPCAKDLEVVSIHSKPLIVNLYLFFKADYRSFVYYPDLEPEPLVTDLDNARRESPGGGSAYVSLGDGWYLRYMWD